MQEIINKRLRKIEAQLEAIKPANLQKLAAIAKQDRKQSAYDPIKGLTPENQKIAWKRLSCNTPMFLPPEVALALQQRRVHQMGPDAERGRLNREGGHRGGNISGKNRIAKRGDCIENHRDDFFRLCKTHSRRSAAVILERKTKYHFDSIARHFRLHPTPLKS